MCHQGQVLTLWHGRVLAIRWPNEFCAYVMRCRATDSHTLVRRAKSFGQDFVAGRYRPPPRRIGSDRIGTAAVTTSPASDAAGHLTKTRHGCLHARWEFREGGDRCETITHDTHCLPPPSYKKLRHGAGGGTDHPVTRAAAAVCRHRVLCSTKQRTLTGYVQNV